MSTTATTYTVHVHTEDDGSLWAEVVDLPGCFASGDTLDELWEALQEAVSLYLTDDPEAGRISNVEPADEPPSRPMRVDELRVRVPA